MSIAAVFVAAFIGAAVATFALAGAGATALGITQLPMHWRVAMAGLGLLVMAAVDLRSMSRSTYCPLGWRRQTPRMLLRRHHMLVVATLWGFDTGLVVTTIRVAAVSWGALSLAALGLAPRWTGVAYGVGFALPYLMLLVRPRLGRAAIAATPMDPGLETMLRMRTTMQGISAALLIAGGGVLFSRFIA
jgi:hypothetical protein